MSMKISYILALLLTFASVARAQQNTQELNIFPIAAVAFGSVTASYTTFFTNTNQQKLLSLDIANMTNADIYCSLNASTDQFVVFAYSSEDVNLGKIGRHESGLTLSCKRVSGAPTAGSVYISARY